MKLIMENWKKFVSEDSSCKGWLVNLGLSRVDHERLARVGGGVAELGPDIRPKTWNINNGVLAAVDEDGELWFKRPHGSDELDRPIAELEQMGYTRSDNLPVPAWKPGLNEAEGKYVLERSGVTWSEKFVVGGSADDPEFGSLESAKMFDSKEAASAHAAKSDIHTSPKLKDSFD